MSDETSVVNGLRDCAATLAENLAQGYERQADNFTCLAAVLRLRRQDDGSQEIETIAVAGDALLALTRSLVALRTGTGGAFPCEDAP